MPTSSDPREEMDEKSGREGFSFFACDSIRTSSDPSSGTSTDASRGDAENSETCDPCTVIRPVSATSIRSRLSNAEATCLGSSRVGALSHHPPSAIDAEAMYLGSFRAGAFSHPPCPPGSREESLVGVALRFWGAAALCC
eukprot:30957-Pelagococcus_subviridis.AAC.22